MKVGNIVRILKPSYAIGLLGIIIGFEDKSGLWTIKLWKSPFNNGENKLLQLSLPESDFTVIEHNTKSTDNNT